MSKIDLDAGTLEWSEVGDWGVGLNEIRAIDVFENGDFAVANHAHSIHRITADEQVFWSTPEIGNFQHMLDVGGPDEVVAVARPGNGVDVFDADGNLLWQADGRYVAVDPDGDVFAMLGDQVEKRAGADGSLLCAFQLPLPGHGLAVDEQGFPVVLDPVSITKYTP